ncbi:unnamed protein product [Cuscuta europaea]|uniref:Retrotransposon gag domain-containing protein n=1 Tax=Cuscuta europaea TaxID=41803 RepID=A0A9P0YQ07_CUSEU|nr:unnamed protein product [Cuscuta europaea]
MVQYLNQSSMMRIMKFWERCDLMVQLWILNSSTKEVPQCILYEETVALMWSTLNERFFQGNLLRIFYPQKQIYATIQGNLNVTDYYNKLVSLWKELNQYNPFITSTCGVVKGCKCDFLKILLEREEILCDTAPERP